MADADREKLAHRIYAASHLTGTFTLRSGVVEPRVLRQVPVRVRSRRCCAHRAAHARRWCPPGIDALAGLELGGVPLATMLSQVTRPARPVRSQGGEDLRHLPARRGRRARRPAAVHRRRRGDLRRRGPRRRGRAPRARRDPRTGRVRDRPRVGRRREAGGAGLELHALFTMHELNAAASQLDSCTRRRASRVRALALAVRRRRRAFSRSIAELASPSVAHARRPALRLSPARTRSAGVTRIGVVAAGSRTRRATPR